MALSRDFLRSKTTWTGLAGLIAAISGYYAGSLTLEQAVLTGLVALQSVWLRDTVAAKLDHVAREIVKMPGGTPP